MQKAGCPGSFHSNEDVAYDPQGHFDFLQRIVQWLNSTCGVGCEDDEAVVSWLVKKHKVCVVPGSACGCPGYVRVAFANLGESKCKQAAAQLRRGLQQLVDQGAKALQHSQVAQNGTGNTAAPCEGM